jgi:endonuclease/exonuclease/phosphatase (EEP) superfamily protein YafD
MALFPALFIMLLARQFRWITLILGLLMLFVWQHGLQHSSALAAQSSAHSLRLMTFNVHFANRDAVALANLIEQQSPDIIAFQEMMDPLSTALHAQIQADYPYYLVDHSWSLPMVLMSRYPLTLSPKPAEAVRALHAQVETPWGKVMVWNVHPTPAISGGWAEQRQLLGLVAQDVAQETHPVIVLGDFNTTNQTENYQLIADLLIDTHAAVGYGFGFTFPNIKTATQPWYSQLILRQAPLIDIDHIFVSHHFIPQSHQVLPDGLDSDHRPVVASVLMK